MNFIWTDIAGPDKKSPCGITGALKTLDYSTGMMIVTPAFNLLGSLITDLFNS